MKKPVMYPLTTVERAALRQRTARALRQLEAFGELPVRVGSPCHICGGLFWLVTGKEEIAPTGCCLNCHPAVLEGQPKALALVQHSMLDEWVAEEESATLPDLL